VGIRWLNIEMKLRKNNNWQGKQKYSEKNLPLSTLFNTSYRRNITEVNSVLFFPQSFHNFLSFSADHELV
jgi:hypothetical protein